MHMEVERVVPKARSAIMGLGGRDIKLEDIKMVLNSNKKEIWVDNYGK